MRIALNGAAFAALLVSATAVRADNAATGLWIDHTGRGAVEITDCGGKLCGHVAWLKDAKNNDQCGKQIIGNVKSVGTNEWDHGWIYDPDRDSQYDLALSTVGADKLRVVGYAGSKWLSETYAWKRAPADLQKCSKDGTAAQATPAAKEPKVEATKAEATKSEPEKTEAAKSEPRKSDTAKTETPKAETLKSETTEAGNATDKPDANRPADTAKKDDATDDADTADNDDGKGKDDAGKIVSRIVAALDDNESGDDSADGKPKKRCKMNVPYVDMTVEIPCD